MGGKDSGFYKLVHLLSTNNLEIMSLLGDNHFKYGVTTW